MKDQDISLVAQQIMEGRTSEMASVAQDDDHLDINPGDTGKLMIRSRTKTKSGATVARDFELDCTIEKVVGGFDKDVVKFTISIPRSSLNKDAK